MLWRLRFLVWSPVRGWTRLRFQWTTQVTWTDRGFFLMNVRRALPKIHFDQTLYRKANTCVFAIRRSLGTDRFRYHNDPKILDRQVLANYCKPLYFCTYFISRFCDLRLFRRNLNLRCMMFSYLHSIFENISRECWIREGSNSQILAKIKFSRIVVNLQYIRVCTICRSYCICSYLVLSGPLFNYRKTYKNSDTWKNCCNYPKIWLMLIFHRVMHPKETDGMANGVVPDQGLQCLPWAISLKA